MSYCTFNRFQGVWLGSILGGALVGKKSNSSRTKIIQYQPYNWVMARDKIAKILIKAEGLEINNISHQLEKIFLEDDVVHSVGEGFFSGQTFPSQNVSIGNGGEPITSIDSSNLILSLLPLIIFQVDKFDVLTEIVTQCNLNSPNATETQEDILIWSYLLALVLNHKFDSQNINVSMMIRQVLGGVEVKTTSLVDKLEIVDNAWETGASLHQLTEELLQQGNSSQIAIALSVYFFATTPKDFMLSVKRAANLKTNIVLSTTALTSAISGAYNGIAGIPRCWSIIANQNQAYQQAKKISQELFETWLGIYPTDNHEFLYDQELHAVAFPKIIQPRKSLKIISQ